MLFLVVSLVWCFFLFGNTHTWRRLTRFLSEWLYSEWYRPEPADIILHIVWPYNLDMSCTVFCVRAHLRAVWWQFSILSWGCEPKPSAASHYIIIQKPLNNPKNSAYLYQSKLAKAENECQVLSHPWSMCPLSLDRWIIYFIIILL